MEYSKDTDKLIKRIEKVNLRQEYVFNKKEISKLLGEAYSMFSLTFPKIIWCKDITDKRLLDPAGATWAVRTAGAAGTVGATGATGGAWATGAAGAAWAAWAVRTAGAAWAVRTTWAVGTTWAVRTTWAVGTTCAADYDFDDYVFTYEFLKTNKGNENDYKFIKAQEIFLKAKEAGLGYFAEKDGILYVAPNPIIRLDDKLVYHCENKPAIEWKNGWKGYCFHGVLVNEKIIKTPEKLTKQDWLIEENLELRRIIQERMPDFVKKIGAKSLQKDNFGELFEVDLKDDPEKIARYVKLKDSSTSRLYYLRVPPTVKTAKEAVSWSFGLLEIDYNLEKET